MNWKRHVSNIRYVEVVGDSHVLKFRNKLYFSGREGLLFRDTYVRGFSLGSWESNDFRKLVASGLSKTALIGPTGRPWNQEIAKYKLEMKCTGSVDCIKPTVLLFVGEIDIRTWAKNTRNFALKASDYLKRLVLIHRNLYETLEKTFEIRPFINLLDPVTSSETAFSLVNEGVNINLHDLGLCYNEFNERLIMNYDRQLIVDYRKKVRMDDRGYRLNAYFEGDGCHSHQRVVDLAVDSMSKSNFFTLPC